MASGVGLRRRRGSPVVDMIDVSVSTRSGCSIAIVWTIIPPIDAPTTWAARCRGASSRPTASAAMSDSVYGTVGCTGSSASRDAGTEIEVDALAVELASTGRRRGCRSG